MSVDNDHIYHPRWEYMILLKEQLPLNVDRLQLVLDDLGAQGWELCSATFTSYGKFIFKRLLPTGSET